MQRFTKRNSTSTANNQSININTGSIKKEKSFSSAKNLIFFIDVAKKCDYAKLEDKIKSVGGTIRLFLTDDVTHFITDKVDDVQNSNFLTPSSPKGSFNCSSPRTPRTPDSVEFRPNRVPTSRTRSRVDEMIYRARLENNISQPSLIDIALLKNICVWDFNSANLYLNKIIKKIKLYKSTAKKGIDDKICFKEPFVKLEDNLRKYRPYYKIFKSKWPVVSLVNCELVDSKSSKQENIVNENNKTKEKKKQFKDTENNRIDKFGYCELCKCEYDSLSVHLKTEQHISIANDQQNYEALDKLIDDKISLKYFLKENLIQSQTDSCKTISKNMTKLQLNDYYSKKIDHEEKGINMKNKVSRVTRQGQANIDANPNGCKKKKSEPITKNKNSIDNHHNTKLDNDYSYVSEVRSSKKEKETQKYNSAKDNSSLFYKVIKPPPQSESELDQKNKTNDKDDSKPALIVKFRKIRQSELSILNGEAENFMFPKSKSELENSKKHGCSEEGTKKISNSSDNRRDDNEKMSIDENESKEVSFTKVEESYIDQLENLNYAFEHLPDNEPWYKVFCRQDAGSEHTFEYYGGTSYKKLPYEIGHVPMTLSNPCTTCMLCKNNKGESNVENITKIKTEIISENSIDSSKKYENDSESEKTSSILNFREKFSNENCKQEEIIDKKNSQNDSQQIANKPFKKFYLMNLDMPRKSPREHASTLAMLSCLVKKNTSSQNSVNNDSKEPTPEPMNRNISATPSIDNDQDSKNDFKESSMITNQINENSLENKSGGNTEQKKIKHHHKRRTKSFYNERIKKLTAVTLEKEIDYFLKKSFSDCLDLDSPISDIELRNNFYLHNNSNSEHQLNEHKEKFSNNFNLEDILDQSMQGDLSYKLNEGLSQKKRSINKTGWPTKKKFITRRQKGCITGFHHHKGILVKKSSPWNIVASSYHHLTNSDKTNLINEVRANQSTEEESESGTQTKDNIVNLVNQKERKNDINEIKSNLKSNLKILIKTTKKAGNNNKSKSKLNQNLRKSKVNNASVPNPVVKTKKITHETVKSRTSLRSPTPQKNNNSNTSIAPPPPPPSSPRVLRKPRGRWYRER